MAAPRCRVAADRVRLSYYKRAGSEITIDATAAVAHRCGGLADDQRVVRAFFADESQIQRLALPLCHVEQAGADEAAAAVRRYRDFGTTSPCVGGITKTDFDATLEALAGCLD